MKALMGTFKNLMERDTLTAYRKTLHGLEAVPKSLKLMPCKERKGIATNHNAFKTHVTSSPSVVLEFVIMIIWMRKKTNSSSTNS